MGKPCHKRTDPSSFEWKKKCRRRAVLNADILKTSSIWGEVFSSEKEEFTANVVKANNLHADIVLVSSDGVAFSANKSALCAASSYFKTMFGGAFREASSGRIVLHSISSGTLRTIMDYLRLDQLEEKAFRDSVRPIIVDVVRVADMLDMARLVKLLCTLLGEGITSANYKNTWAIYDTCPNETLYAYLRASFRHNYRHFLNKKSFLTFDLSLMRFALDQWVPFVNHQLLVKLMLRWIRYSPKRREGCLDELSKILRPERLPAGLMNHLAAEEEILQRHPDVLQRFQTSETTVDTVQFRRGAGYEVIADAISVFFFDTEDDTSTTVRRFSFSGCREEKVLPFIMRRFNSAVRETILACVQYKSKIYIVGHVAGRYEISFIEYEFDDNSFVVMDSSPIYADYYCDAFVVGDRLYVHCLDSRISFVQFYDFVADRKWTHVVLNSIISENICLSTCGLCPYENSYLTLQADGDINATKVTSVDESSSFTIPCKYNRGVVVHYNGKLWGCSERRYPYEKRKFVYDVDKKCFKSSSDYKRTACFTKFMRISSLRRHPLIVQCEMYLGEQVLTLIDMEHDTLLGKIEHTYCLEGDKCLPMGMLAYCKDITL